MKHPCLQFLGEKRDYQIFVFGIHENEEPESDQVQFVTFEETEQTYQALFRAARIDYQFHAY